MLIHSSRKVTGSTLELSVDGSQVEQDHYLKFLGVTINDTHSHGLTTSTRWTEGNYDINKQSSFLWDASRLGLSRVNIHLCGLRLERLQFSGSSWSSLSPDSSPELSPPSDCSTFVSVAANKAFWGCQDSIPLDRARTLRTPSATDAECNKHLHAQ